jgi:hypothetical protein
MPPASFSLLPPRLAELLATPASPGVPAALPYAIAMSSVGVFTSSPILVAGAGSWSLPQPLVTSPPPALMGTTGALIPQDPAALDSSGGATVLSRENALRNLALLTASYGARTPVSGFPAHGPAGQLSSGPPYAGQLFGQVALPQPPLMRQSSLPGAFDTPAPPASAPVHFAHNLPVKLTPDNYLFWRAQIIPLLRSHSLECFVDGTCPCPPPVHPSYRL